MGQNSDRSVTTDWDYSRGPAQWHSWRSPVGLGLFILLVSAALALQRLHI